MRPTRSRHAAIALSMALVASAFGVGSGPVAAASPLIAMTLTASPNPAAQGTTQTFTGTITPVSGTPTNVRVHMEATATFSGGTCSPAAQCTVALSGPSWVFPTLTSKVTVTYATAALGTAVVRFYDDSLAVGCSGTCPPSVDTVPPTVTSWVTYESSTAIIAGASLHVTVHGSTDAGPVSGYLSVDLPDGVDPATSVSPGATYSPAPYHSVGGLATLNRAAQHSFDVVVNAADGSTLVFMPSFYVSGVVSVSQNLSIPVGPDSIAPVATAPVQTLVANTSLNMGLMPVHLGWTGADNFSGVARYILAQSTDGHAYSIVSTTLTSPGTSRNLAPGHAYQFRVRAIDHAGNAGWWAIGSRLHLAAYQQTNAAVHYLGSWGTSTDPLWWGGTATSSTTAGSIASLTFTGRSFAWIALKASNRGKAQVFVNGVLTATVDLYSTMTQSQRVVWAANWSTAAARTVLIKVLATAGRPRVDLDGIVTGS